MSHLKTAVILFNLGGPDSLQAVQPFLFNLFNDPYIINAPNPIRYLLARFISFRRRNKAKGIYTLMGGKSPILPQTINQSTALEAELKQHGEFKVFNVMRYWHPFAADVVQEVKSFAPDKIILLPLYPQFSTSTTASSIMDWRKNAKLYSLVAPENAICCYPKNTGFIEAYAELIKPLLLEAGKIGTPRLLFSAHGLPVKNIKAGDPYQWQIEQSTASIVNELAIEGLDYKICYQSKVGPLEWLSPSTEHEIIKAAKTKTPIVIVPISFVSEHSETLVELDMEYKELAYKHGLTAYFRVPTVSTHPKFIKGLAELCLKTSAENLPINMCPSTCTQCFCKK